MSEDFRDILKSDIEEIKVEIEKWKKEKRVCGTQVGPYFVSTVRLLIGHGFSGVRPLWFETMVFHGNGEENRPREFEDLQWRYETREEAIEGHEKVVKIYKMEVLADDMEKK